MTELVGRKRCAHQPVAALLSQRIDELPANSGGEMLADQEEAGRVTALARGFVVSVKEQGHVSGTGHLVRVDDQ
jgi:hypothetical protein